MLSSLDKVVMHERVGVHDVELDNVLYDVHRLGAHIIGDKLSKSPKAPKRIRANPNRERGFERRVQNAFERVLCIHSTPPARVF
jgi:hypothetical protein